MLETRHDFTEISIHSLHTEGDPLSWFKYCRRGDFNPLPPHGGRPGQSSREPRSCIFQSTPSTRRETAKLHRKAFFISPILVQSCKKGCKRLHSAPEKMIFFEKGRKIRCETSSIFLCAYDSHRHFPSDFSHRISGSSMSMVPFAPICSTFD